MPKEIDPRQAIYPAQTIFQRLCALRNYQYIIRNFPTADAYEEMLQLENDLRTQIEIWGDIEAIDFWLSSNDPHHGRIANIKELDLSWLT
ncbi:TPA: hypothetical protein DIU27_04465 [Candidatus Collierbacteria bacterium]|uniref:Uncharacterized protein n=1 Tax=Candidatus Collierbacteria bacterium GW2011_GWB2_44_22 TaxID=1618387 RepID=A0A0G1HXQ4_9BACT|nr:MAG: hypothetical protein UW31_C0013G0040 [Candidatus Collierbacteria bacterium GW2011_GWA2_44_13]KKT50114.1 MAG: hypothetical protein UW42_C0024G0012 [Candidatus Collierbacteria bacterium GW2011_GWB1_44_197]KKT51720.1 MAG: hypothetical protein UW44_C0008G0042 [Candidatus Collierbacteria bacterium GW2011_GWB2_44_22]KKT62518.1 MAG: hypothetical protein UW56_C0006G0041 [Candidatus Collierbacteria bacterium GW2011_GWD1_44_27]KKT66939.1 MAG: hypothetical protein UW58_C0001G0043 [Candidatus Colli